MDINKLEEMLHRKINKFIHKRKGAALEPDDVKEELKDELFRCKKISEDDYIPNNYEFFMNPVDCQRLSSKRLFTELYLFAEKTLIVSDCYIDGDFRFKFCKDEKLSQGKCLANSYFDEECGKTPENDDFRTVVMDKNLLLDTESIAYDKEFASLLVIEGMEKDFCLEFGRERVNIGRKDNNDIVIADMNVSRRHAYISFENGRHVLHDANSLNGTFVNENRIVAITLQKDDEIRIGNTVLLYDVI